MFLEQIQPFIRANAEIFGLLTFFIGLGVGHWLALGRDKRKEFNEAALPIRTWLLHQISSPSPMSKVPTLVEIDRFTQCLPAWKRYGFRRAYERQRQECEKAQKTDSVGSVFYGKKELIIAALQKCLPYTNRK